MYTTVFPMWGNSLDDMVFTVELPLVRATPYLAYEISTYEVPYPNGHVTIRLEAGGKYGMHTQNGEMFELGECKGLEPRVCKGGVFYNSQGLDCARSVIGHGDTRRVCQARLTDRPIGQPVVLAALPGNTFIVLSWGALREHCPAELNALMSYFVGHTQY